MFKCGRFKPCSYNAFKSIEVSQKPKHWNYYIHIAIAPTKNNDRLEWFLEKATEIGIDEITPIICSNSERKIVKTERLQKIIQAAMKQSLQTVLPQLNEPIKFNDFISNDNKGTYYIAHCENEGKKELLKNTIYGNQELSRIKKTAVKQHKLAIFNGK